MNLSKFIIKLIAQALIVITFFSTAQSKNIDKFNDGKYISNYFSGILLFNDSQYDSSAIYLKKLEGLENSHSQYSSRYLYSLINSGNFNKAYLYSKKLEKKNLNIYESDLIMGIYFLKNKNYDLSQKYFSRLDSRQSKFVLDNFIVNSLVNWGSFSNLSLEKAEKKIDAINPRFKNLKKIQKAFLHCYYASPNTDLFFQRLSTNKDIDFSRYNYFYVKYLTKSGKIEQAKKIIDTSLELFPRNVLLNQYKIDLSKNKYKDDFNCQNQSHVVAEILYIVANALSTQSLYNFSNFFLNLSKYLNNDFYSFDTLLAENYYEMGELEKSKKIYNSIGNNGAAFLWYASKQNAKILSEKKKKKAALKLLENAYKKHPNKNIYLKLDYAKFLKNNKKYNESVNVYSEILKVIDKLHPLYPEITDGRGVAYERLGEWKKAEKDLLSSLEASPEQAYVLNYLAYSWLEQGIKIEQSLKMLKKANKLKTNDPYIIDSLGWALYKLGKYKDSKKYLQNAVELLPADPTVNDHYGDVLWKIGDTIQARYYWNYVLNLEETEKLVKESVKNKLISGL